MAFSLSQRISFTFMAGCLLASFPSVGSAQPAVSPRVVRIALLNNVASARIRITEAYELLDPQTNQPLEKSRRPLSAVITAKPEGIQVGVKFYPLKRLRFVPKKVAILRIRNQDRRYRGAIDVTLTPEHQLLVVNRLDVDEYIKGVLYHEASNRWPMEAIKAQAVASRTYAYYQLAVNAAKEFDVTNDIYSQVYGGRTSEKYRTNVAVERTRNEVLTYRGKIIPAYFHATCGGATEDVGELWNNDLAPLHGVKCNFCVLSPHTHWKRNLRLKDIQDKLNAKGFTLGLIREIRIVDRNASGRIKTLEITTRDGQKAAVSGKDFRNIVGPNIIRSNNYEIVMQGYYVDFLGHGWGHGVGLCQWGAYEMAQRRFGYQDILKLYYPGVDIVLYAPGLAVFPTGKGPIAAPPVLQQADPADHLQP